MAYVKNIHLLHLMEKPNIVKLMRHQLRRVQEGLNIKEFFFVFLNLVFAHVLSVLLFALLCYHYPRIIWLMICCCCLASSIPFANFEYFKIAIVNNELRNILPANQVWGMKYLINKGLLIAL